MENKKQPYEAYVCEKLISRNMQMQLDMLRLEYTINDLQNSLEQANQEIAQLKQQLTTDTTTSTD